MVTHVTVVAYPEALNNMGVDGDGRVAEVEVVAVEVDHALVMEHHHDVHVAVGNCDRSCAPCVHMAMHKVAN